MDAPCRIRSAAPSDAAALAELERRCFDDPWSAQSFREALTSAWSFVTVAERAGEIAGYLVGREVGGAGEVLNLAVAPGHRRRGIAQALLEDGLARLRQRGATEVFLEVRESNHAAQRLYYGRGFATVAVRAKYYRQPVEDARVLRLDLLADPGPAGGTPSAGARPAPN